MQRADGHVYVVDDDAGVRRALCRVLKQAGHAPSAFGSGEDFLMGVDLDERPACLVVDLRMPGLGGLELQQLMLERGLEMAIVFISGRADVESGVRAMKGGAIDFLEKPFSDDALLAAVSRALAADAARRVVEGERARLRARLDTLTPRERDVFGLIVTGLLNKQVGARLGTTEKTVKVHRSRVMHKMGAGSLAELVRMSDRLRTRGSV